jgi:prepilin-type N-terminal cleavage/methylation domain-containing protein
MPASRLRTIDVAPRVSRAGMTMLELLLVMGLLGVLLGAGVGVLASINLGERAAVGLVQNSVRSARNAALARGAGARVRIDAAQGELVAEALEVVGTWHFESQPTLLGAFELDGGALDTVLVDDGYVGKALAFPRGSKATASVAVQNDPSYDLSDGFRIQCAVRVDEDGGGRLLRLGDTIGLDVSSSGVVRGWFTPEVLDSTGRPMKAGKIVVESAPVKVPASVWRRVVLDYDRQRLALEIEGLEMARADADARVWPIDDALRIGDDRSGFVGAIDSLVISAVGASEVVKLPEGVRFAPESPAWIRFDAGGALDRAAHSEPLEIRLVFEGDASTRTIRVGMYGTVE